MSGYQKKYKIKKGDRFRKLVAIKPTDKRNEKYVGYQSWKFKCDCGNIFIGPLGLIIPKRKNSLKSCGCLKIRRDYLPFYHNNKEYESNIHEFRVAHGYTNTELAKKCNTSQSALSNFANGTDSPLYVTSHNLEIKPVPLKLMKIFDASFEDLFPRYACSLGKYKLSDNEILNLSMSQHTQKIAETNSYNKPAPKWFWNYIKKSIYNDRYFQVLYLRFVKDYTLEEIGIKLNVTRERIRQIETKALNKLRHPSRSTKLKEYY